ncbi:MAG: hypothetical protein IJY42_00015 [Clostridia bacterium]|nr:hypothetical protein [Clostridia bacterium]
MKKMKFMRIAAVLLVLCLASTCAISGTFAKYTSEASGKDSARVAKWGWGTTTLTFDLFDSTYDNVNGNGDKVVAPGTTNTEKIVFLADGETFKPEVAYSVTIGVEATGSTNTTLLDKLVWTLNSTEYDSFAEFKAAVAALSATKVDPNTELPTKNIEVTWEWPFEEGADADAKAATDAEDTQFGNDAADGSAAVVELTFTITVTQVD